ncbi:phage holin family protein [Fulvivirga sp. M361]|uniref:phage holin family protein n=1 Tax=Fulvivirga sp. M361 TaxID=2594266 RepID=UPI00117ABF51|nr:phage holin family protein [Fulvivirga sp. M361]TRX61439.1 phage holin family protein [Fulvivirga sp. M361]
MSEKKGLLNFLKLDNIVEHFIGLVESKIEIAKIEIKAELAQGISKGIVALLLIFFMALFFLFLNIAIALFIGHAVDNLGLGFLMVSGFYLVVFILLYLMKDFLKLDTFFEDKLSDVLKRNKP